MENFIYSSIFGELTRQTQLRFDAVSKLNKQLFDNVFYPGYLRWDIPTVGLDFNEIIGKYNMTVSAATVDENSKAPVRVPYGPETLAQRVLKHAHTYAYPIQEYRKVLQILDSRSIDDATRKQQLVQLMWGGVTDAVAGVEAVMDKIFLGALSNRGVFTFDATTNPEGGVKTSIDYKMPSANYDDAPVEWTDANLAIVDVFGDILKVYQAAYGKSVISEIWCSADILWYVCRATKLKTAVFGNDRKTTPLTIPALNEFMRASGMPVFRAINRNMMIQNQDGSLTPHTPWNGKNIVFVPAGELGVIKNAYADSELRPEKTVAYSNYGRIRVSQWGAGEAQGSNSVEFTKAEALALPVITAINGIYSLKVRN